MDERQKRQAFHRHPMVIDARKRYRLNLSAGMPEKEAWKTCDTILRAVRLQLDEQVCEDVFGWHFGNVSDAS